MRRQEVINIEVNIFRDFHGKEIEDYYDNDPEYTGFESSLIDHADSLGYYLFVSGCDYNSEGNMASLVGFTRRVGEEMVYLDVNVNLVIHQSGEDRVDIVADGKKMESFKDTAAYVTDRLDSLKKEVEDSQK